MPRPKSEIPFERKAMNFVAGDYEAMGNLFPRMGAAVAIRTLVHNFVARVRASTAPINIDPADLKDFLDE